MDSTFVDQESEFNGYDYGCAIEKAPIIPKMIKHMRGTFSSCTSLKGSISVPCHIIDSEIKAMEKYFDSVEKYHYEGCGH